MPSPTDSHGAPSPVPGTAPPIRVLHVHSSQGLYGPERWTHLLLRSTRSPRVQFRVLTLGDKPGYDEFARFLVREGFAASHLSIAGKVSRASIASIRNHVVEHGMHIVHTHGFKSDVLGYLATRGLGVRLVTTPHGWCDHEGLRIRAYETIGRMFLAGFDRVYPLSDHQAALLSRRRRLRSRVRCIRNAVDIDAFTDVLEQRRTTPLAADAPILFVGRLRQEKGILELVQAFATVAASDAAVRLVMAGAGPDREAAEALAARLGVASRVRFLGFCADVRPLFASARCLALPSYSEGIPRVVMEAFSAGVPVVSTEIPGVRELVTHGETGLLARVRNVEDLAHALTTIVSDPEGAQRMATAARRVIERDYSPQRLVAELDEEYEALVRANAAPTEAP
ncbi:MAG TPA: glycosyltransferase family 4 protein [Candidatus Binatia bacterium]|jgi:glycosyltransferase involved in cell wall biosynthesis